LLRSCKCRRQLPDLNLQSGFELVTQLKIGLDLGVYFVPPTHSGGCYQQHNCFIILEMMGQSYALLPNTLRFDDDYVKAFYHADNSNL
jgi:hypothetical protein